MTITNQELRDYWKKVADAVSDNMMQTSLPPDAARATKQDTMIASLGNPTDAEATGAGSIIGVLKRLRTLIGDTIVTIGSAIGNKAQLIAGSDGTNARAIKTASDGTLLTQLTGSIVEDDHRLRVVQKEMYDLTGMTTLMLNTSDGTLVTDLVKAVYGRTMLLLSPYSDNILWTRSAPSAAFWGVSSWTRTSGTKIVTPSTTTGPTESGVCTRVKIGTGGTDTTADYSFDLDFTNIKALSIYTKLEEFGIVGSQILIYIGNTQIYSSGPVTSAREHDWTKRTFDVSSITGVQTFRLSVRAFYTGSEPRYSFGNLVLEVG